MTNDMKIKNLRIGIMCAIVHRFDTHPDEVLDMFTLDELEKIADQTKDSIDMKLEGLYKDLLDMTM